MNSNQTTIFQANMKKARRNKNWSQEGAAKAIGITRAALGSYEEGRAEPNHDTLKSICLAYEIKDLQAFLHDSNYYTEHEPEELLDRYNKLPAYLKYIVNQWLKGVY